MSKSSNDQSKRRITDRVSNPLLMTTFLLSLFVAFTDRSALTNLGIISWVPTALLLVAVVSVFVQLCREPIQADSLPRKTADSVE